MAEDRTRLCRDDRARLNDIADILLDLPITKQDKAERLLTELQQAEADDDSQADRIIKGLARAGAYRVIDARAKLDTGIFVDSQTGQLLNVPRMASVRERDDNGQTTGASQQKLWHELTWAEFDGWVVGQRQHAVSMTMKVRGLQKLQRLRQRFPKTQTPGQACRMAGIDPASLDIAA